MWIACLSLHETHSPVVSNHPSYGLPGRDVFSATVFGLRALALDSNVKEELTRGAEGYVMLHIF